MLRLFDRLDTEILSLQFKNGAVLAPSHYFEGSSWYRQTDTSFGIFSSKPLSGPPADNESEAQEYQRLKTTLENMLANMSTLSDVRVPVRVTSAFLYLRSAAPEPNTQSQTKLLKRAAAARTRSGVRVGKPVTLSRLATGDQMPIHPAIEYTLTSALDQTEDFILSMSKVKHDGLSSTHGVNSVTPVTWKDLNIWHTAMRIQRLKKVKSLLQSHEIVSVATTEDKIVDIRLAQLFTTASMIDQQDYIQREERRFYDEIASKKAQSTDPRISYAVDNSDKKFKFHLYRADDVRLAFKSPIEIKMAALDEAVKRSVWKCNDRISSHFPHTDR